MQLKFEQVSKVYFYEDTSEDADWLYYRRDDSAHGNWQILMGESWEALYDEDDCKELESFHQQTVRDLLL